jgi:hypothetical protein
VVPERARRRSVGDCLLDVARAEKSTAVAGLLARR